MLTDGAIVWSAWLEQTMERRTHTGSCSELDKTMMRPTKGTQQCQGDDEQDHEQKQLYVHEAFSLFEMSRRIPFLL